MTNPSNAPGSNGETVVVNERLWQKWLWKNRELDKADARKRLRFFQVLLCMTVAAALLQNYLK